MTDWGAVPPAVRLAEVTTRIGTATAPPENGRIEAATTLFPPEPPATADTKAVGKAALIAAATAVAVEPPDARVTVMLSPTEVTAKAPAPVAMVNLRLFPVAPGKSEPAVRVMAALPVPEVMLAAVLVEGDAN